MFLFKIALPLTLMLSVAACGSSSPSGPSSPGLSSSSSSSSSSGTAQTLSAEMDKHINKVMQDTGATAITVAVAKNGKIEFEKAYGFQNAEKTIELQTDALMRTASIVKPVTAAAIRKLASSGALSLSDYAFCAGNNSPCWLPSNLLSSTSDSRAKNITIEQLLDHLGGWYRTVSGDPFENEVIIRDSLSISHPPTPEDIVRYVMKSPLDFTPGNVDFIHENYSNFGYLLLGMIIEKASHSSYVQYVQTAIMNPLGITNTDFKAAASRLADRDPREPIYIDTNICPSVFTVGKLALCIDEGADGNNWVAAATAITTAKSMALFAQSYRLPVSDLARYKNSGEPLLMPNDGVHYGSIPGLTSRVRQLPSGVSYAIFINISTESIGQNELDRISQLAP